MANRQVDDRGIQKKRIIYMGDADWKALKKLAEKRGVTMSSMIRDAVQEKVR